MGLDDALTEELAARAKRVEEEQADREAIVEMCRRFAELARQYGIPQEVPGFWAVRPFGAISEDGTWYDYLSYAYVRIGVHDPAGPPPTSGGGETERLEQTIRSRPVPGGRKFLEDLLAKTLADARAPKLDE